jgi:PAS domain S-box-containing protein
LVREAVERSLNTGEESEAECRILLPDGQIRWITRRGRVEFDRNGKPARMNGVWFDITERRLSEAALRDTERRMELAANAAGIVIWTWDIPRDNVWLSEKDRALFGFSAGERLSAERIRSVVHTEDRELLRELVKDTLRTHKEVEAEYRVVLSNGGVRWVTRRARVEFDREGNPARERGVLIDITERKQAEVEMARQRGELAHLSRVTMLGELSGSLAHELNQPLTAILSNAQAAQRFLAEDDVDLAEVREILNDIVAEDKRAGEVIQRLRLLLKKGEAQQHSSDININDVVHDVLKLMRNDFINQNVSVTTDLGENLPAITGDRIQLQQVILNLVLNACEAMTDCDRSECELRVVTHLAKDAVRVSVRDRGGSIPEEKLEHVFDPFFTTKEEGMGLGLSVCQTIIKAHRGRLWATNNVDRGATFHFSLPVGGRAGDTDN